VGKGGPDGPNRLRPADLGGDPAIGTDLATRDLQGLAPDGLLEGGVAPEVQLQRRVTVARDAPG
jgi:hypothetical protein